MTKVAIVYYSSYGTTHAMAQRVAQAAEKAGAEVRLRHVRETAPREAYESQDAWKAHVEELEGQTLASPDDLDWADVVVFGSPTRYGHVTSQLQSFIDTLGPLWAQGKLADKVYTAFTSSQTLHGGQESTLLSMMLPLLHHGMLVVGIPYTEAALNRTRGGGSPYGASHVAGTTGANPIDDDERTLARVLGRRVADVAARLERGA